MTYLDTAVAAFQARFFSATGVDIPFRVGERSRHIHHAPPAVCWVSRGGKAGQPKTVGRQEVGSREIVDRTQDVDVYLYAETAEQSEAMHLALLALLRGTACKAAEIGAWEWLTERENDAGWVSQAGTIRQRITLHQAVFREGHDLREVMTAPADAPNGGQDFASTTTPSLATTNRFTIEHVATPDGDIL